MRNRLIQLLADNRQRQPAPFAIAPRAAAGEADVLVYGPIVDDPLEAEWFGGVAAETFVSQIKALDANTIHLRINSPGGSVFAARAMEQALREHSAQVVVHIDGVAASAASFLAMAGERIIIAPGAMVMIHKAWTIGWGNSNDLHKTADLLEKIDGTLVDTYVARTGNNAEQVAQWMADETWFTGREAVDAGFADSLTTDEPAAPGAAANAWNLSAYERAPAKNAAKTEPKPQPAPPPTAPVTTPEHRARQAQRLSALLRLAPNE